MVLFWTDFFAAVGSDFGRISPLLLLILLHHHHLLLLQFEFDYLYGFDFFFFFFGGLVLIYLGSRFRISLNNLMICIDLLWDSREDRGEKE